MLSNPHKLALTQTCSLYSYSVCHRPPDLAGEVACQQDVPGCQVTVYKALLGEVVHASCYVPGKVDELSWQ